MQDPWISFKIYTRKCHGDDRILNHDLPVLKAAWLSVGELGSELVCITEMLLHVASPYSLLHGSRTVVLNHPDAAAL